MHNGTGSRFDVPPNAGSTGDPWGTVRPSQKAGRRHPRRSMPSSPRSPDPFAPEAGDSAVTVARMSGAGSADVGQRVSDRRERRLPLLIVAAAFVIVVVAVVSWVTLRQRPTYGGGLEPGERYGIDVSAHQHEIDWERVHGDGIEFAYIKATEGGDFVDDRFAANWDAAAAAGVERGAYHFFTLCRPGADQADNFLRTVPADDRALPPVVDLEFVGNCSGRPDPEALIPELTVFVDRVEAATGQEVVFYLMNDFDEQYGVSDVFDRQVWVRSLDARPSTDDWLIWQTSDVAPIAGIEGGVDLDVMKPAT